MAQRKQIALFLFYDETWIAGAYYITNLISSLKLLPDGEKPLLTIIGKTQTDIAKAKEIAYPYIDFQLIDDYRHHPLKRAARILVRKLTGKEIFSPSTRRNYAKGFFDAIFPAPILFDYKIAKNIIYWIPDFQEEHLPHFFTEQDIKTRKQTQQKIAGSGHIVVFSSQDALNDFNRLYPVSNVKRTVLNFSVTHPAFEAIDLASLREKYKLPDSYFFCPNQFWAHKNHKIVLAALAKLRDEYDRNISVVFSGKEHDYRNPGYAKEIRTVIEEKKLESQVSLLGFIDRSDQLAIMKNAVGVIQPSLFEGWSTVIEDAKSMNQNIIASDIAVHREQLGGRASFFDPYEVDALIQAILNFSRADVDFCYEKAQSDFGKSFLQIVNGGNP